jgi:hypothetical protein
MEKSVPEINATLRLCHCSGVGKSRKAKGVVSGMEVMDHEREDGRKKGMGQGVSQGSCEGVARCLKRIKPQGLKTDREWFGWANPTKVGSPIAAANYGNDGTLTLTLTFT